MNIPQLLSPSMKKLTEEITTGNKTAIDAFWLKVAKEGTPLIESIEGNNAHVLLTFLYRGKEDIKTVVVYGSLPGYRYSENQLTQLQDTDVWFKTYKVRNDIKFKYNFCVNDTLDDDYKKRKKNSILDPMNPNKIVFIKDEENLEGEESKYSLVELFNVKPEKWTRPIEHCKKGNLELHRFHSEVLNKTRRIWVYTPYNYNSHDKPYNLLVLTDGFDYINILSAETVLNNLLTKEMIEPTICVFIDTTDNRFEELTCNKDFSKFVSQELFSWIRENYNATENPNKTTIGGVSLGGLTAAYLGLKHSELFGNVLAQSGSFWWESERLTKEYENSPKLPLNFYLSAGILEDRPYDDEPIMMDVINNMRDLLLSKGYKVHYELFPSGHDYLGWSETLATGLIKLVDKQL